LNVLLFEYDNDADDYIRGNQNQINAKHREITNDNNGNVIIVHDIGNIYNRDNKEDKKSDKIKKYIGSKNIHSTENWIAYTDKMNEIIENNLV